MAQGDEEIVGDSPEIARLKEAIVQTGRSEAKVLVTGESGVGKDLVARAIHNCSPRAMRPFVPINCAGLSEFLLESELFGHVRGSFTGAHRDKSGTFELADRGTAFLDEVGEMTPRMQALLLRFLETGEIQKVGSDHRTRRVNVRIIAATNRNLRDGVARGQFREDLYYRLNVIHLVVPPLRQRPGDIPLLVEHFLERFRQRDGARVPLVSPEAIAVFCTYSWPGNVRELLNVLERVSVNTRTDVVHVEDLPAELRQAQPAAVVPRPDRRPSVAADLYRRIVNGGESFWTSVYPLYMEREIATDDVREVVRMGLEESRGNYKLVSQLFNMEPTDYKRFLNFLRKHGCQISFKEYRQCNRYSSQT